MIKKLQTAYSQYKAAVKIELVIYWIVYHLIMLYFIFGKEFVGGIVSYFNDSL